MARSSGFSCPRSPHSPLRRRRRPPGPLGLRLVARQRGLARIACNILPDSIQQGENDEIQSRGGGGGSEGGPSHLESHVWYAFSLRCKNWRPVPAPQGLHLCPAPPSSAAASLGSGSRAPLQRMPLPQQRAAPSGSAGASFGGGSPAQLQSPGPNHRHSHRGLPDELPTCPYCSHIVGLFAVNRATRLQHLSPVEHCPFLKVMQL